MDYLYKTKPFKHQLEALSQSATKKNFAYFMEMGCVDGETEFLTHRGWVKFKDFDLNLYPKPLIIAQAIPCTQNVPSGNVLNWRFQFTEPISFIKKECEEWYKMDLKNKRCTDIPTASFYFTADHNTPMFYEWRRVVMGGRKIKRNYEKYLSTDMYDATAKYIYQVFTQDKSRVPCHPASGISRPSLRFPATITKGMMPSDSEYFEPCKALNDLTEWELRFMVAVMADGTYPNKWDNKVDFYFKKERKAKRLEMLAKRAGIPLVKERKIREVNRSDYKIYTYHCVAPLKTKLYTEEWYSLPLDKLDAIYDEFAYWDGTMMENLGVTERWFYSVHKDDADFIQFVCAIHGDIARITGRAFGDSTKNTIWTVKAKQRYDSYWKIMKCSKLPVKDRIGYCFRVPSGYLVLRRDDHIFVTGNSGKTKVMLDNIGKLYCGGHITGALVLAPKGVYRNWSEKEIPTHLADEVDRDVIVWDASASDGKKRKMKQAIDNWDGKKLQFLVFNIESLISEKGKKLIVEFIKRHSGNVLALVDESTCIKNHKAKRTKAAIEIGAKCKARRIATGSPVTNSPLDLYSQCAFLDKSLLGHGSYYSFKYTYADIEKIPNRQGQYYEKVIRYKNLDHLSELLKKFSYRITKKECLDLPDKIYMTRDVELTPEQEKVYREMYDYQFALLQNEEGFKEMSTSVVLTKFLRLHQVLCGTFTSDDGTITRLPNNRVEALKEVLDETSGKVIIWATYLEDIKAIMEMLEKEYGKESFVTYYGATSSEDRTEAINKFQDESSPVRFFLGNVQTAGRGITLTAASTVVYYSNNFSLELRQQSEDRAHRLGQKNNVTYIDLVVRGSLDEKIIKSLIEKRNIANEILKDDLEDWITLKRRED